MICIVALLQITVVRFVVQLQNIPLVPTVCEQRLLSKEYTAMRTNFSLTDF